MTAYPSATRFLEHETRALLTRLAAVKPFVLQETAVAAAALSPAALAGIEDHLIAGRRAVRRHADEYLRWLQGPGAVASAADQQRRFGAVRRDFQGTLSTFDLFSEVITQRSESDNGVLLSGLDVAAAEALRLPGGYVNGPPVVCALHSSLGGAIRRSRTRLPGGGDNPVAIIRIPRERMIGYGIASTLAHEAAHEGASLLGLVESLRAHLLLTRRGLGRPDAWRRWELWISEVVADFWSIGRIGIGSTLGLIALVSLPRRVVFRPSDHDPHPVPWIRVLLSCAIGERLYPDPQWRRLAAVWRAMYPVEGVPRRLAVALADLEATIPDLVTMLVGHRPFPLGGHRLGAVLRNPDVCRDALLRRFAAWRAEPDAMHRAPPTVAFAVLGQARASGLLTPEREARLLRRLITAWAVTSTLATARAATRADVPMFVGQPAIWADATSRPDHLRNVI
ncbi:MAG: hypothetical protein ABW022_17685 [Actinoplanes sp.]